MKKLWWTQALPDSFSALREYAKSGPDWRDRLSRAWEERDAALHPQLEVLGKVLGTRAFLNDPIFKTGDGVTIVQGGLERYPATVRFSEQGLVLVTTDYHITNKSGVCLFLPTAKEDQLLKFTLRRDGVYRMAGSTHVKLEFGRSYCNR